MMRLHKVFLLAVGVVLVFSANAIAAGSAKIGYLDRSLAGSQSQWGKKISDDLKREHDKLVGEIEQKKEAFTTAASDYEKKKDVMDEKTKSRKQKELQEMSSEAETLYRENSNKWNEQAKAAQEPILKKIMEIANKIAKDDKFDYILEKGAVIVGDPRDDLTQRVITELDRSPH